MIFRYGIEAGTCLDVLVGCYGAVAVLVWAKVAVAADLGLWVEAAQVHHQVKECALLILGAGILGLTLVVEPSHIHHADAVCIVAAYMSTDDIYIAPLLYGSVQLYEVVVADICPALRLVHPAYVVHIVVLPSTGGGAVNHNVRYGALTRLQA